MVALLCCLTKLTSSVSTLFHLIIKVFHIWQRCGTFLPSPVGGAKLLFYYSGAALPCLFLWHPQPYTHSRQQQQLASSHVGIWNTCQKPELETGQTRDGLFWSVDPQKTNSALSSCECVTVRSCSWIIGHWSLFNMAVDSLDSILD